MLTPGVQHSLNLSLVSLVSLASLVCQECPSCVHEICVRGDELRWFAIMCESWLVVWNILYFSIQLGMSSSQLTNMFQSGVGIPPTRKWNDISIHFWHHQTALSASEHRQGNCRPSAQEARIARRVHGKKSRWHSRRWWRSHVMLDQILDIFGGVLGRTPFKIHCFKYSILWRQNWSSLSLSLLSNLVGLNGI